MSERKIIDSSDNIMEKFRFMQGFIDMRPHELPPVGQSIKTLNDVMMTKSNGDDDLVWKMIAQFEINAKSYRSTVVHLYESNNSDISIQISDLPPMFWFPIKSDNDVTRFLRIYNINRDDNQKHIRYDLRRNSNYRPIMMERYIMLSNYTNNIIYGPHYDMDKITLISQNSNTFDLSIRLSEITRQCGNTFNISTMTRYSQSQIIVNMSDDISIMDIYYEPDNITFVDSIKKINCELNIDIDVDLPIDIVLFLLPFLPISINFLLKSIDNELLLNDYVIDTIKILSVNEDKNQMITILKNIYKKIKNMNKIEDSEKKILFNKLKYYITNEYISMIYENSKNIVISKKQLKKQLIELMKRQNDFEYFEVNILDGYWKLDTNNHNLGKIDI